MARYSTDDDVARWETVKFWQKTRFATDAPRPLRAIIW